MPPNRSVRSVFDSVSKTSERTGAMTVTPQHIDGAMREHAISNHQGWVRSSAVKNNNNNINNDNTPLALEDRGFHTQLPNVRSTVTRVTSFSLSQSSSSSSSSSPPPPFHPRRGSFFSGFSFLSHRRNNIISTIIAIRCGAFAMS